MVFALGRIGWVLMALLCVLLVVTTLHYFGTDRSMYFQPDVYMDRIAVLRVHIVAGIIAALTGPLQFWPAFRNRFRAAHRTLGKAYIVAVLTHAAWNFSLSLSESAGGTTVILVAAVGFVLLFSTVAAILINLRQRERRQFLAVAPMLAHRYGLTPAELEIFSTAPASRCAVPPAPAVGSPSP